MSKEYVPLILTSSTYQDRQKNRRKPIQSIPILCVGIRVINIYCLQVQVYMRIELVILQVLLLRRPLNCLTTHLHLLNLVRNNAILKGRPLLLANECQLDAVYGAIFASRKLSTQVWPSTLRTVRIYFSRANVKFNTGSNTYSLASQLPRVTAGCIVVEFSHRNFPRRL